MKKTNVIQEHLQPERNKFLINVNTKFDITKINQTSVPLNITTVEHELTVILAPVSKKCHKFTKIQITHRIDN